MAEPADAHHRVISDPAMDRAARASRADPPGDTPSRRSQLGRWTEAAVNAPGAGPSADELEAERDRGNYIPQGLPDFWRRRR
jgi:hypothetical protein